MCRFVAYLGKPIVIDEILTKPVNSLVNQSYDAEEMAKPLNGDGFGLGWYARDVRASPGLFRSITPAWNNENLLYNASVIKTSCMFAHVRAASVGAVSMQNCHPFHYKEYLLMHNGRFPDFKKIKREILAMLPDELFLWINGSTDSEHIFALLLQQIQERYKGRKLTADDWLYGFRNTFSILEVLKESKGIREPSTYNMMITDGSNIFGTRYSTDPDKASPTLYYSVGSSFEVKEGVSRMLKEGSKGRQAVMIVSEKLTEIEEDWKVIPPNHFISVSPDLNVRIISLD